MVLAVAGCSGIDTTKQGADSEFITDKKTDFFIYGPSQPGRPVELEEQEFVTVQRRESGYCIVRLSDGRIGWVDASCLRPAPPSARAVSVALVFPEKVAGRNARIYPPLPEPDLRLPVDDVPLEAGTQRTHQVDL
jgi:hypothetical protein